MNTFFGGQKHFNVLFKLLLLFQEAKEDAEMDAEIALEMAMEQQRRSSITSSRSSVEGTYVGPCPHSPGQVGQNAAIIISDCQKKPQTRMTAS